MVKYFTINNLVFSGVLFLHYAFLVSNKKSSFVLFLWLFNMPDVLAKVVMVY